MDKPAFEVDKRGLEKLLERRGREFAVLELVQNALDERGVTRVDVRIEPVPGTRYSQIRVEDDAPEGFADLSHAYTLFAESKKKGDPEQRGRFNLGEKLVLALCRRASITTTTGTVEWEGDRRRHGRARTESGSIFDGEIRMSGHERERSIAAVWRVLVPEAVVLTVNGERVPSREPFASDAAALPTEIADAEGYLRRTERKTVVLFYDPRPGEVPHLFEMGIPVVELDGGPHVNVLQKVPLNADRDNVTPAYLRQVRTLALNAAHPRLTAEDARAPWVSDALTSEDLVPEAVDAVLTARYGDRRVVRDPSDPESTKLAVAQGYAVIEPGTFNRDQWATIKRAKAALPSGQVTPSPKPYSPNGAPLETIPEEDWTPGMRTFARLARRAGAAVGIADVRLTVARRATWPYAATYARGGDLVVNVGRVGHFFFDAAGDEADRSRLQLLIHELGHEWAGDHLSADYHEALCRVGAALAVAAFRDGARVQLSDDGLPLGER